MVNSGQHVVEHNITAQAPAQLAYDLLVDVARWPQHFTPIVHTEHEKVEGAGHETDLVTVWALRGADTVRTWTSRRTLDPAGLRICFVNDPVPPGLDTAGGEWTFQSQDDGSTKITVRHEFTLAPGAPEDAVTRLTVEFANNSVRQLTELKAAAERADELAELIVDFTDPLFVCGSVDDAYEVLYAADKWPQRLPHVLDLTMTENVPNIQFFDMLTATPDGHQHTTRSVRVCLPPHKIVYKQISLPPLLSAHTGHWTFAAAPEGLVAAARHTATIKPSALHLLGDGTTVADARRYLRRALGNNSMTNLRLAKRFAEDGVIDAVPAR
jgi:C7-C12 aromatase (ARO/CYC)